jgi:hypothetical protein
MSNSWRRLFAGVTSLALCMLLASPAGAWEFSLSGWSAWEYYQFSQLGDKGFFGPFDQDNSSVKDQVRLAARNGWLGHEAASRPFFFGDDLASGSDVAANYMYTIFIPSMKVNEALSMRGVYRIGSWQTPSISYSAGHLNSSRYLNSDAPGIGQSFSPGYWQLWNIEANLPWGTVQIGKQPNSIGLGLIIDSLENSAESVTLGIPFGPFSFGAQYYPWGPGRAGTYPLKTDRSGAAQPHFSFLVKYSAGNIATETYVEYTNGHKGLESELYGPIQPADPALQTPFPMGPVFAVDASLFFGFTNIKYFNGRFFFNAEVGFHNEIWRQSGLGVVNSAHLPPAPPSPPYLPQTRYWELWAGMIECGVMAGPAKISFLWAYYPGPDRRGGKLIDRQPTVVPLFAAHGGVNLYLPYSLLLGYDYGSGNGSITRSSDHGFITDASTYGARLDYALAANLNAYATFLYASRISQGYGWGWIRPDPGLNLVSPALQYGNNGNAANNLDTPNGNLVDLSFAIGAPNILERDLGYEIGGGIDWKLIEGYTLGARVAYWKPGAWFKYACVDRRQPNWDIPDSTNMWGINPNREIAPIFGTRVTVQVDF